MNLVTIFEVILGTPKTIIFNFSQMPLRQAVKLPVLVSHRVKFKSLKGRVDVGDNPRFGMVRIGLSGSGSGSAHYKPVVIENNGVIKLEEKVRIGGGTEVCTVRSVSELQIGRGTRLMGDCHIVAADKVSIGEGCAISWNTQIMDTDFHSMYEGKNRVNTDMPVSIGNHVWIASHVLIMKGVVLPNNTVVAAGSIINKGKYNIQNDCVITGLPNRMLKENISWEM